MQKKQGFVTLPQSHVMPSNSYKYLLAYTLPAIAICGLFLGGSFVWLGFIYAFVVIPFLEIKFSGSNSVAPQSSPSEAIFFDILLFFNIPLIYFILIFGLMINQSEQLTYMQSIGLVLSVGTILGSSGINVAHELGHRQNLLSRIGAKLLLLPALYSHFTIEHNRGHHKNVSTPLDPATSRFNESVYQFWIRSVIGCYANAWKLESSRLKKERGIGKLFKNEMVLNTLITILYLTAVFVFFGNRGLIFALFSGIIAFLLLECINYIEHYGLKRKQLSNGMYEQVSSIHSWNSEHQLGRIMLYELTRHSDHHYKSNKKFQNLEFHEVSPQLPFGYPASIILSLFPPLWYKIMNSRVPQ